MSKLSFRPSLTLRGRSFHGARGWAGKPLHPPLTDVPIGAYMLTAALDAASFVGRRADWSADAYRAAALVLVGGAAVSLLTAFTGYMDWRTTEAGTQVRRTVNAHAPTMITVTVLVLAAIGPRVGAGWHEAFTPLPLTVLSAVIAGLTFVGATIGGSAVYDYGFNVENAGSHPAWEPSDEDLLPGEERARVSGAAAPIRPVRRERTAGSR